MPSDLYEVRGHHPDPSGLVPVDVLTGAGAPTVTQGISPNAIYFDTDSGDAYQFVGGAWVSVAVGSGGGGGGDPEVFKIAGSGSPGAAPVGGAGVAYNADGAVWIYTASGWTQIIAA